MKRRLYDRIGSWNCRAMIAGGMLCALTGFAAPNVFYVSPTGSDSGNGSESAPFGTIPRAIAAAGETQGAVVVLLSGTYRLHKPLEIGSEASGLTIRAAIPGSAIVSGAQPITGWKQDPRDKRFLVASVPFSLGSERKFRTFIVGTNVCRVAAYPGYGDKQRGCLRTTAAFEAVMKHGIGGFEPPPTFAESVTLPIDRSRLPKGFELSKVDLRNAWVDLWHMWNDSPCEIASNNLATCTLYLRQKPVWPPGMMNDRFELLNLREGLIDPGNWMLNSETREVVYYPRKGENAGNLEASLSDAEQLLVVNGAQNLTIEGIVFEGCSAPFKRPSFGGRSMQTAVQVDASDVTLRGVTVRFVSGMGLRINGERVEAIGCDIGFTGGQALRVNGSDCKVSGCRIHDSGFSSHAASLLGVGGMGMTIVGNRLWNAPYCGVVMGGQRHLYASNDVSHVMRVLQDGGALYGGYAYCTIRDNFHHDMLERGFDGYGQSAYYADEGSHDNLFTGNRSENVEKAVHNHITRNNTFSNNVFCSPKQLTISFQNSVNGVFVDNSCYHVTGLKKVGVSGGVGIWERNRIFKGKRAGAPLSAHSRDGDGDWSREMLPPMKPCVAIEAAKPPKFDGVIERNEWGNGLIRLGRDEFGYGLGGNPTTLRAQFDKENLYLLVETGYYVKLGERITTGGRWGRADGVQFDLGKNLIVTLMSDGTVVSSDKSFKPKAGVDYLVSMKGNSGAYALRVPFSLLGKGKSAELPFNVTTYVAMYDEYRHWDTPSIANPVPGVMLLGQEKGKGKGKGHKKH